MITTCLSCILKTASAKRYGSVGSNSLLDLSKSISQYGHALVQPGPIMRKVAVPLAKHSPIFGQLASWHTVLRFKSFNKFAVLPIRSTCGALTLNHSGFEIKLLGLLVTLNFLDL